MTRIVTAVVLLAVLLPVTVFAPIGAFGALIAFILIFAAWEWARLLKLAGVWPIVYAAVAGVALIGSNAGLYFGHAGPTGLYKASALFWLFAVPFAFVRRPTLASGAWRVFLLIAGIVIFLAGWHALVEARLHGVFFVLSLLLIVWCADIGAYFSGRRFGRHKLAPSISPGKTWEGAIGGWLAVMLLALVVIAWPAGSSASNVAGVPAPTIFAAYAIGLGLLPALAWVTVLVAFSIAGDLFESLLKRQAGVKDSSGLLPGHGGVLDRIDALLPALPIAMLMLR